MKREMAIVTIDEVELYENLRNGSSETTTSPLCDLGEVEVVHPVRQKLERFMTAFCERQGKSQTQPVTDPRLLTRQIILATI